MERLCPMRILRILTRKELNTYFLSPFGWVVLAFVVLMQGASLSTAMKGFRDTPVKDSLVYVTFHTPVFWFYFLFIFPLITMRLFADEERSGTLETLLTAPVRTWQVVLSKYFAAMIFYIILWIPAYFQFQAFSWFTEIPPAYSGGALLGSFSIIFLMGAAFTAIGCLASALTSSQIIAGIITITILVIHYFLGFVTIIWGESFAGSGLFHYISSQRHLHYFANGLIDSAPVVYYLSLAAFVLFLTYQVIDLRRWRP
ncbi:MAG: ABC transporter permease [Akkermansiaceae bacterium]|nr:ABC transporter permease [Akkermansiaceae bacterium]MDP4646846.1 ABC transporter permease [Akkermansiaceae bacterium]MDP4719817.1 ABC transporter permease [Akkermansiaceae bacterium]MDP4780984.1 ABC transporter permease [Akkermansiaceae bacterium]